MPLSSTVSRRFTPPTCTLEISARVSPLSRWSDRPVWKHVRFQLRFDDPRVLPEEHVVIQGDRIQLEKLADAVGDYVQRFLHATPSRPVVVAGLDTSAPDSLAVGLAPDTRVAEATDPASLDYLEQLHQIKSTSWADMARLALATSVVDPAHLVGSDADHADGHVNGHVNGNGEIDGIDAIAPERHELNQPVPTPATNGAAPVNSTRDVVLEPHGLLHHRLRLGALATAQGDTLLLNTTQLFDLATALDDYRTAGLAIPTLNQQRWIQRPASWGKIAAGALIALALTPAIANIWDGSTVVSDVPTNSETATSLDQQQAIARIDSNTITEGEAPINPYALEALPPPPPAGSVQPNAPATLPRVPVTSNPRAVQRPVVPPPLPGTVAPPAPSTASAPSAAPPPAPAGTIELEIAPQPTSPNSAADSASAIASAEADSAGSAPATLSSEAAPSAETSAKTAFDTVPQVAQVRQYFQDRWAPPESLEDTLEYRLTLAPDGSLQEVTPLGQASEVYLDRTSIPLRGEPFISPSPDGSAARIRLVLSPNGTVQTFAE